MNKRQTDKVTNYQSLRLVLDDPLHQPLWASHVAFTAATQRFYGSINVLAALAQAQGTAITGLVIDKDRLADSLIRRTLIVAGAVAAYASVTNQRTLFAEADIDETDLRKLRDAELDDAAQAQHDRALARLAALADYGLTATLLGELQNAITAYSAFVGKPFAERAKRKTATDAIPGEFARADQILDEQLDRLIRQFEATHTTFVAAYRNARQIVQSGGAAQSADDEESSSSSSGNPPEE